MESVYEREANLSTNSLLGNVSFSPKANVLFVKGSRLTLNYDLFKIFDKDLIKVGHWKNSSLEILENPRINTESSKIDLMGAQIRISAVNVSLWWANALFANKYTSIWFSTRLHLLSKWLQMTLHSLKSPSLEKFYTNWWRIWISRDIKTTQIPLMNIKQTSNVTQTYLQVCSSS